MIDLAIMPRQVSSDSDGSGKLAPPRSTRRSAKQRGERRNQRLVLDGGPVDASSTAWQWRIDSEHVYLTISDRVAQRDKANH